MFTDRDFVFVLGASLTLAVGLISGMIWLLSPSAAEIEERQRRAEWWAATRVVRICHDGTRVLQNGDKLYVTGWETRAVSPGVAAENVCL